MDPSPSSQVRRITLTFCSRPPMVLKSNAVPSRGPMGICRASSLDIHWVPLKSEIPIKVSVLSDAFPMVMSGSGPRAICDLISDHGSSGAGFGPAI